MRLDYHYVVIAVNISELCKKKKKQLYNNNSNIRLQFSRAENRKRYKLIDKYGGFLPW